MNPAASAVRSWNAEGVRFVAFPVGPLELAGATEWWTKLVGRTPEVLTTRQGAVLEAAGPVDIGTLHLVFSTLGELRSDLVLNATLPVDNGLPSLGEAKPALEFLRHIAEKWVDVEVPVRRVGFGAVLHSDVSSVSEGYQELSRLLPSVKLDVQGSSEFLYQINRPRRSQVVDGLMINRVSKWSVASRQHLSFSFAMSNVAAATPGTVARATPSAFSIRLELDINTIPTDSLPSGKVKALLGELVEFAEEIWTRGDVQ